MSHDKPLGLMSYQLALCLPLPVMKEFDSLVTKWITCNGEEWVVNRLKTIYTDFTRYRAGLDLVGTWYKKNKEGLPSGIFSYLFKCGRSSNHKIVFSAATLLRSYTKLTSEKMTSSQVKKFLDGVLSEPVDLPVDLVTRVVESTKDIGIVRTFNVRRPSFLSFVPSPSRTAPTVYGKSIREDSCFASQCEFLTHTRVGKQLWAKYPNIFIPVMSGIQINRKGKDIWSYEVDAVGKIGLIQEPGYKLRAVANPNRILQVALQPLGEIIYNSLRLLPWDCTFDQTKGFPTIQQHLKENLRVYCFDLSGATDYFPLSLQIKVLRTMFPDLHEDINLFEEISRAPWFFQGSTISWTKGQPLGLYPSFGSFALTHGIILYCLNNNTFDNKFFVLGDDVIILDDSLALRYLQTLKQLGCPISPSKSITSKVIGEFGGKIISKDTIEPQLKWKKVSDDNFIDILRLLGQKALRLLRPRQRKVAKLIMDIPDFLGGLGFNPNGLSLSERYYKYLTLQGEDRSTFLMSYNRMYNSFFMSECIHPNSTTSLNWDKSVLPDLDQRSVALVLQYLPQFVEMYGILGTNLYLVSPDKGVLPIDGECRNRSSVLSLLERKLGIA